MTSKTPILDQVSLPHDLRGLDESELNQLANEVRQEMIDVVSTTGGHLGAGLGVVELTIALHYVFNTPDDKLLWDVGHQAYPHKIIAYYLRSMGKCYGNINTYKDKILGFHNLDWLPLVFQSLRQTYQLH